MGGWIWMLPLLLTAALAWTFAPLFLRKGEAPLAAGLEDDPRAVLVERRDLLLRQLKELELDAESRLMSPEEAQGSRAELEQELGEALTGLDNTAALSAAAPSPAAAAVVNDESRRLRRLVDRLSGAVLMVLMAVVAVALYLVMGTPIPPPASQEAGGAPHAAPQIAAMVEQLAQRLASQPDDREGWLKLGRSYGVMGQADQAMAAYQHVLQRFPNDPEGFAGLAELQVQSEDPRLVAQGAENYRALLAQRPDNMDALWVLGMLSFRGGQAAEAVGYWERLNRLMPVDHPSRAMVQEALTEAKQATARAPGGPPPGGPAVPAAP
ncbi:MAG: tetratricopeptide repeat protein [Magnetococcales bacterium]|nr:tetratricopeptide repeat protein [Magnetococcales bacterium]